MALTAAELQTRAKRVRLVLLDVDGVLTDGTVIVDSVGGEAKGFFVRDGLGIAIARREGLAVGLLSGRHSEATTRRAAELGIDIVSQSGPQKAANYARLLDEHGFTDEDVAFMGDDLLDLAVHGRVGLSAAPADAVDEVRTRVDWVSRYPGGRGAVREFIEMILRGHGRWEAIVLAHQQQDS